MLAESIIEAVKKTVTLCDKVVESGDAEKYSNSVKQLYSSVDETYAKMREVILEDETMSSQEKLENLEKLAKSQIEARQACEQAIKDNKDKSSKVVPSVLLALSTGGVSIGVSGIINKIKKDKNKKIDNINLDSKLIEN